MRQVRERESEIRRDGEVGKGREAGPQKSAHSQRKFEQGVTLETIPSNTHSKRKLSETYRGAISDHTTNEWQTWGYTLHSRCPVLYSFQGGP